MRQPTVTELRQELAQSVEEIISLRAKLKVSRRRKILGRVGIASAAVLFFAIEIFVLDWARDRIELLATEVHSTGDTCQERIVYVPIENDIPASPLPDSLPGAI